MPIPERLSELVTYAQTLAAGVAAGPPLSLGVPAATSTLLTTRTDAFVAAYEAAANPATRTRGTIAGRDDAKRWMLQAVADVVRLIQGTPTVTDQQKYDLGVTVPKIPANILRPDDAPGLEILKVEGRRITARFFDPANPSKRGKPYGIGGVGVFSHTGGDEAPADPADYKFEGFATTMRVVIEVPADVAPGTRVFITGFLANPRGMSGPACTPVGAYIGAGGPPIAEAA